MAKRSKSKESSKSSTGSTSTTGQATKFSIASSFLLRASRIPLIVLAAACAAIFIYHLIFLNKIYPGVRVGDYYLGGKTEKEAVELLRNITPPKNIVISAPSQEFSIESSEVNLNYDAPTTARNAFLVGRSTEVSENVVNKWQGIVSEVEITRSVSYDQEKLNEFIERINDTLFVPSIEPGVKIEKGIVIVERGRAGQEVDIELLNKFIVEEASRGRSKIIVPFKPQPQKLTDNQVVDLETRGKKIIGKSITLKVDQDSQNLTASQLADLIASDGKYNEDRLSTLVEKLSGQFNRPVQEATFKFEGGRVLEFKPTKAGIEVEKDKLKKLLTAALTDLEKGEDKSVKLTIPASKTEAKTKTGDVNNLGIRELIGKGTSRFRGSILSRVHNVALAASRINGILIAPGETFSFNKALGDVSEFTGFQQAYIIRDGRTVLGDGGGVCQVSTTLFRAALAAGVPIVERRAHSYRVSYYEQDSGAGFDATVFDPTADLKIKNDTPAHILIQTAVDKKNLTLTFELYGTSDGRIATTSKSKVWDQVEPPADLYQDDPSLPAGTVKQVDFKAWGAKASFDYSVVRGNEQLQKRTFSSNYRPWQAIFLRGTAPN
ncbi:VanW family protein [Candidatus Microgenomates bacterium]|nr:VanW family protein [Candidatus Microgenomates bacterium]